jgi:hypothetical protein
MQTTNIIASALGVTLLITASAASAQNLHPLAQQSYRNCLSQFANLNPDKRPTQRDSITCACLTGAGVSARATNSHAPDPVLEHLNDICQALAKTTN